MATRTRSFSFNRTNQYGATFVDRSLYQTNTHSTRVKGKLVLRANAHYRNTVQVNAYSCGRIGNNTKSVVYGSTSCYTPQSINFNSIEVSAANKAFQSLSRRIRGESTEMGMNFATWNQSWNMIGTRAKQISALVRKAKKKAERSQRSRDKKVSLKDSADHFLEGQFGWAPLLADIVSLGKVLADDIPVGFVRGTGFASDSLPIPRNYPATEATLRAYVKVTQSVQATCSSPNLWLLNKLGLINPATVAWDLVPWSFLVNEFVNLNHIMNSFTAFAGLTLSNGSTTVTRVYSEIVKVEIWDNPAKTDGFWEQRAVTRVLKTRKLGLTYPRLEFKMPTVSMMGALIKLSLLVQQISKLK